MVIKMSEKDRHGDELSKLERENSQLRHRIRELESELNRLRFDMGMDTGKDDVSRLWRLEAKRAALMGSRNYVKYIISLIKSTSVWGFFMKGIAHFRKFRLLSAILRTATRIAVWAESGVAIVAWLSFTVFMLPFLGVISTVSLFVALFRSRSAIKHFEEILKDKKIYILFAAKSQLTKKSENNGFLAKNAEDLAHNGAIVLIVSPYFLGKHGIGGNGFYVTAREEMKNVYMVRRNFFFLLRRNAAERVSAEITTVY